MALLGIRQIMFPDFSYLYKNKTGIEAYFTYFCLCLWWLLFWVAIIAGVILLIALLISPILIFYFGIDIFKFKKRKENFLKQKKQRAKRKDSKANSYMNQLDMRLKKK